MCPACLTTAALAAASAGSAGGLRALVIRQLCAKTGARPGHPRTGTEGARNGSTKNHVAE